MDLTLLTKPMTEPTPKAEETSTPELEITRRSPFGTTRASDLVIMSVVERAAKAQGK